MTMLFIWETISTSMANLAKEPAIPSGKSVRFTITELVMDRYDLRTTAV